MLYTYIIHNINLKQNNSFSLLQIFDRIKRKQMNKSDLEMVISTVAETTIFSDSDVCLNCQAFII